MPSSTEAQQIADVIGQRCQAGGLDLHATTSVGRYNGQVDQPYHLPGDPTSMVVVIGNSRAIWPHLDRFVLESREPLADPVDTYVQLLVAQATTGIDGLVDIRFAHEPPPRRIAIQRLADVAGLAWLSPSHLCIHPTFGPWIALRAAVVLDVPAPPAASRVPPPCSCADHCLPQLDHAMALGEPTNATELIEHWRAWLAMRDACPIGRQHRYDDEQIRYHYTGERPARWGG